MPQNRYFTTREIILNGFINIIGDEFIHLSRIMRKKKGDIIEIINGRNILATGKIESILKKEASIKIINIEKKEPSLIKTAICIPFLKQSKLDLIVEKTTELNISEIILYKATHSEIKELSENKIDRLKRIIISAVKQCGRLDIPQLSIFNNIENLKSLNYSFFYGDIDGIPFSKIKYIYQSPICFIIGPEKGFSKTEKTYLKNPLKSDSVLLNQNILRAETAAISAATLINSI